MADEDRSKAWHGQGIEIEAWRKIGELVAAVETGHVERWGLIGLINGQEMCPRPPVYQFEWLQTALSSAAAGDAEDFWLKVAQGHGMRLTMRRKRVIDKQNVVVSGATGQGGDGLGCV